MKLSLIHICVTRHQHVHSINTPTFWNAKFEKFLLFFQHNGATGGYDMNIIPAWKKGYSGKGVVLTILDDGIEHNHPDLQDNYVSTIF